MTGKSSLAYQNLIIVSREAPLEEAILTCCFMPTQVAIG
jgi:hypothetical protein